MKEIIQISLFFEQNCFLGDLWDLAMELADCFAVSDWEFHSVLSKVEARCFISTEISLLKNFLNSYNEEMNVLVS